MFNIRGAPEYVGFYDVTYFVDIEKSFNTSATGLQLSGITGISNLTSGNYHSSVKTVLDESSEIAFINESDVVGLKKWTVWGNEVADLKLTNVRLNSLITLFQLSFKM
jgi:hypothetical protein